MKTIIIEDEKPAARLLQRKLDKLGVKVDVMLHSVEEAIAWFSNNKHPDLIFLDIQLSDGLSFEIFEKVTIKSAIIFTTAYDEYALKAFKLNSIDYLLKPIDDDELSIAIFKFRNQFQKTENIPVNLDFEAIKKMFQNPFDKNFKTRFIVKIGQQLKIILIEEIECFFSENKGTYIHTFDNRNYLIDLTLEVLEQDLDPENFFRISRKFIVPLKSVKEIILYSNSRLKIVLPTYKEEEVVVSREKVQEFKSWIG
ncbi:response regulator transcription factor [Flavobacterium psychrophilum]|jgi:DNA-binding LytR/AlgR family response regulator|uniref:Two-component system response regulatory protein, LytTR family n=9 Tax=Flavobacterium psychrophilum TaxID=96345 RepID=A6H041_FLAPJ|nr:LytTR family DNA-binding domain-containing protein [Flavobacterium psychrophilum]AIG30404.1 LytR family transcriptional regulator [Flavobacterium psychrophilum]AIG32679.1 LytR family transcriptional regulator [Flavobacterium psychrophilum]AIG34834.1 LytR family transcriptional regulator [Flavobacterium psychrophilum]AIG37199.1 LytR family transcriptional regulator [Flavobacterium psychrophilum]AIG39463.1 LytR family transcriptional regulator [Flavobacterium psychrophilum]